MPKILAIDDKPDNLLVLQALLKNFMGDCTLVSALSGREGLKMASDEMPDTIVLDVKMPQMDGYEVCRLLKADPVTRHIPVVMLTAVHIDSKSKAYGLEAGADAFLTKPIDEVEFIAQIKAMLRIKKAEDLLRQDNARLEAQVVKKTKELRCLYTILSIGDDPESSFDEMMQKIAQVIAPAWQYPEIACTRIGLLEKEYVTDNFKRTPWGQSCDILLAGKKIGCIEVYYLKEIINGEKCTFPTEERSFLQEIAELLRKLVEQETAKDEKEKLKEQLQQAQKMEAIGTLAGGIAHDFNNILSAILGYTELSLASHLTDQKLQNDLNEVYTAGIRAKELVKQILAFSRVHEKVVSPLHAPIYIKEALKLLRSSIPASIDMQVDIDEGVGLVVADPTHIHQIVMNICTNGAQAMEAQGGTLIVKVAERIPDTLFRAKYPLLCEERYLELSFEDTGTGIAPEHITAIFDPYFTTKTLGDGTGLGLAITYSIVQNMGGTISVQSELGKGSVFTIYLPISDQSLKETDDTESDDMDLLRGSEHILLVDDELPILKLTTRRLEKYGYTVTAEENGQLAYERFLTDTSSFDMLISDINMPKIPGDVLASKLLTIRSDLPILLASGYSKGVSEETVVEQGAKGLLHKPITERQLLRKVREVLDAKNV